MRQGPVRQEASSLVRFVSRALPPLRWAWALGWIGACTSTPGGPTGPAPIPDPPAEVADQAQDQAQPAPVVADEPRLLTPVAFREGRIELAVADGRAFAFIDGEPIPLVAGQGVARQPGLATGLGPDKAFFSSSHVLVGFGGSLEADGAAELVYAEQFETAATAYFQYSREADRWTPRPVIRRGGDLQIETHYGAIVAREGALLGLRRLAIRSDLWDYGDPDDPAPLPKLGRELGKAPRGFVVLRGELAAVPKLAKGWDASDVVSTGSGELVALGYRHRATLDDEHGPLRVLQWAPGEVDATTEELPGLDDPNLLDLEIWVSGDEVLIGGLRDVPGSLADAPYLARRGPDRRFEELPLTLPRTVTERVASATITATGELWIVTGARNFASAEPCQCLWRRPVDGDWEAVELGRPTPFADDLTRWAHVLTEQTWIEVPAADPPSRYAAAQTVTSAGGAVWVSAELGRSYPSADPVLGDPRMVLFSSVPVASPTELPATDRIYDERLDAQARTRAWKPGSDDCRTFTMVIADDPDGAAVELREALIAKLPLLRTAATIEDDDGWASASMIYVGELDGQPQLVVEASAWNPRSAEALADGFTSILGRRPSLDCRPRAMIRAIERLR